LLGHAGTVLCQSLLCGTCRLDRAKNSNGTPKDEAFTLQHQSAGTVFLITGAQPPSSKDSFGMALQSTSSSKPTTSEILVFEGVTN